MWCSPASVLGHKDDSRTFPECVQDCSQLYIALLPGALQSIVGSHAKLQAAMRLLLLM